MEGEREVERMEARLQKLALEGKTQELLDIYRANPLLLHRVAVGPFNETPLHVAALCGHVDLAMQLLRLKPDLAVSRDSRRSSPLHLASAKGYVEIVKALVQAKPEMCVARDRDSLNPLHLAAKKGQVEAVGVLVRASPNAARATLDQGETVLHLCVRYFQIEALTELMNAIDDPVFFNAKDAYGNTILHLAVGDKQTEIVKYILQSDKIDVNSTNVNGYTALDILAQSRRDVPDWDIGVALQDAGALKASALPPTAGNGNQSERLNVMSSRGRTNSLQDAGALKASALPPTAGNGNQSERPNGMPSRGRTNSPNHVVVSDGATQLPTNGNNPPMPTFLSGGSRRQVDARGYNSKKNMNQGEWLAKKRDALMVVASLLAAMAFQAGVNPPGGVWQENSPPGPNSHRAGEAVIAFNYRETYKYYLRANTISLVASLSTILLLISGLPFRRKTFMGLLMVIMWVSITSMAFTYAFSIVAITPKGDRKALRRTMYVAVPVWCGVMALLLLGHAIRFVGRWLKSGGRSCRIPVATNDSVNGNQQAV